MNTVANNVVKNKGYEHYPCAILEELDEIEFNLENKDEFESVVEAINNTQDDYEGFWLDWSLRCLLSLKM